MAFELPVVIRDVVERMHRREYVLPAIQREFVWKPDQIARVFDSLLKGYPIGSFLFWTVEAKNTPKYDFYHFVQNYHERDARHNPKADLKGSGDVTAVLDGQQRLTSLYIGLRGTYAYRKARQWKSSDHAYPKRQLYLNLSKSPEDPELTYDFRFLEEKNDVAKPNDGQTWFRVGKILELNEAWDAIAYLGKHGLAEQIFAREAMAALHKAVHITPTISFYRERSQDLDRVLTIFVRVNSGGTVLSYSDLLLSMATAEWTDMDARETIYTLVDDINKTAGRQFAFSKDFVLKTCLMLADLETRFSTTSFTSKNMKLIEKRWPEIESAIRISIDLLVGFGFSGDTLASINAIVPIVYYIGMRGNPKALPDGKAWRTDREVIHRWLNLALLKRTFTGQPDSVLRAVRDVIKKHGAKAFPAREIIKALETASRDMSVDDTDLDRMLDERYGSGYAFATLALLYPLLDFRNLFHQDHIHPRSQFTSRRLARIGVVRAAEQDDYLERRDGIANLQLLSGTSNQEKAAKPFKDWLDEEFKGRPAKRNEFLDNHYTPEVDLGFKNFVEFYEARRELMKEALREALDV